MFSLSAHSPSKFDTPDPPRGNDPLREDLPPDAASLTLAAFMKVSYAVAIVAHDGRVLLGNPIFRKLFDGDHAAALLDRIDSDAPSDDPDGERNILFPNGRTFRIKKVALEQGWFVSAADITDRLSRIEREAEMARTDHLTKLGNRLLFRERLTALLQRPDFAADQAAILTIDLHRFKAINDSLGRNIGDALLCLVSRRIRSAIQDSDTLARLDGDEFGIIQIAQPQPAAAAALATRLVDLLGRPYLLDGQLINIAACVGIALPTIDSDCDLMLKNADLALHRAKDDGHGSYRFFEPMMDERMQARRALEIDLRRALALREFALVYQPQFDLRSRRVAGFEALLRWQCPTRGAVTPNEFIPLAEETGVIIPVGEWVIRTACREAAKWPEQCSVAVNVSAVQFGCPNLVPTIVSALAESGLDPRRLELEITESVMLDARGSALAKLQNLRSLGVRVSLDDFGTG
ncbi:MAG TPA: EAL domain-containing protein, partial [Rhodospirillales bacterium]|nr:EAL domain-containing protein [Rhodospirillales bacterium]